MMVENSLLLRRIFSFCGILMMLINGTNGSCRRLSITTTGLTCTIKTFNECSAAVRSNITVTSATVSHSGTSVDATEAANDIIHCREKSCTELAYFLLVHYSEQFCITLLDVGGDLFLLTAEIAVSYSGASQKSFLVTFDGWSDSFFSGNRFVVCTSFTILSLTSGATATPGANSSLTRYANGDCDEQGVASTSSTTMEPTIPTTAQPATTLLATTASTTTATTTSVPTATTLLATTAPTATKPPTVPMATPATTQTTPLSITPTTKPLATTTQTETALPTSPATASTTTSPATTPGTSLADMAQPSEELETTASSSPKQSATAYLDLQFLLNPEDFEQSLLGIGTNLSKGQSVNNVCVYRSTVSDLNATGWKETTSNGNQFSIPANILRHEIDQQNDGQDLLTVTIIVVESARHAELLNNYTMKDATDKTDVITQVASDVVTAFVFIGDEKVSVPFSFNLTHSKVLSQPPLPKCGFFDTQSRNWNFSGCREIPTDNANMTSCYCDHMTSFAILVQLRPNDRDVNEIDIFIGAILTRCGIGLSVTSLIISLIIFFILRQSMAADRVIIHTNLMIAILFFDITFLFNTNPIEIEAACKSYAFILHYFSLAMMFWMLVEGVHLYRQIIKVFDSDNLRTWVYGIIGWGLPALIITITGGVRHQSYGYGQNCWLNPNDGTFWAFGGPLILITFVNVIILALVVKTVVSASRGQLENDKIKQIRNGLRSTILLFPLLGTTWLLAPALILFPGIRSLTYIYNVLNPLQGFFISLFYCFLNTEVRNVIKEHFRKARDSRNLDTNSGTASTSEGKTAKSNMRLVRVAPAPVSQTLNIPEVCN